MNPDELTAQLRDIKPAVEIPAPASVAPYWIAGLVVLAVLLAVLAVWWWLRHRKQPVESAITCARRELRATDALLDDPDSDAFAIAVSNVLRRYLARHLGVAAVRQTTEEFLIALVEDKDSAVATHRSTLREFLHQCDLVKFARGELRREQRQQLQGAAREFIEATANPPAAPKEIAPAGIAA